MNTPKHIYVQYAEEAIQARHDRDFLALESAASKLYNHFVHNPKDYINMDSSLAVGSIFASSLGYQEPDDDIQEVRAENAIYCLVPGISSKTESVKSSSVAYLFLVFSVSRKYTWQRMMKLFGAPELLMNMRTSTYFSLPEDVRAYILKSDMNTDTKFNSVLSYLEQLMSDNILLYLDLNEEKSIFITQLAKLQESNINQDSLYLKTGKTILEFLFEDIKSDIMQYINYNN